MSDISKQLAQYYFSEIEKNIAEAEECWKKGDVRFADYTKKVRELLREFEGMFEG